MRHSIVAGSMTVLMLSFVWIVPGPLRSVMNAEGVTWGLTNCPTSFYVTPDCDEVRYGWETQTRMGYYAETVYTGDDWHISTGGYSCVYYPYSWPVQTMPPDDSTIHQVILFCYFQCDEPHNLTLRYALGASWLEVVNNDNANWKLGPNPYDIVSSYPGTWGSIFSNITGNETWTPAMVKSTGFFVRLNENSPVAGEIRIDYIGIFVTWYYGGTPPPGEDPPGGGDWGLNFTGNTTIFGMTMVGIMGMVGFFGMIATPAAAVWSYQRTGGSKIIHAVLALAGFMFCFTMFLAAVD